MQVSLIFIAESRNKCQRALEALDKLQFPRENFEVIIGVGANPSAQRNAAAKAASGEFLLFLDNDSIVDPRILHYYVDALQYEQDIDVVGGPALHSFDSRLLSLGMSQVFCSPFGLGPFRARYSAEGKVRKATERELILCNMLVRRDLFIKEKGFNTDLYPNEENEFLNRVQNKTKVYFHPLATCYRDTPSTFAAFVQKMLRYGAGRAKHMLMFPQFWDNIFLAPAAFTLFVSTLPIFWALEGFRLSILWSLPFVFYATLALFSSIVPTISERRIGLLLLLPILFFCCHFFYGFGILWGFARHPFLSHRPLPGIEIFHWKQFKQS